MQQYQQAWFINSTCYLSTVMNKKQRGLIKNSISVGAPEDECSNTTFLPLKSKQQRSFQRTLHLLLCPPSDRPTATDPQFSFPH